MPLFCNTEVLASATKTREVIKDLFLLKNLCLRTLLAKRKDGPFFNKQGKRAADERKKRVLAFASENKKGKERER